MRHNYRTVNGNCAAICAASKTAIMPRMKNVKTPYEKIMEELEKSHPGLTERAASLSVSGGKNPDVFRNMKRGRARLPQPDYLPALALLINKPVTWLTGLVKDNARITVPDLPATAPNATIGQPLEKVGPTIPLYGSAVGGVDGEFELNGNRLDDIIGPASLAFVRGAYAVTVQGESMVPRYEDGETAFVNPNKRLKRGDYCVAQIQREEHGPLLGFVKRFVSHNAKELVLEQLNPARELRFPAESVHSVHYILRGGE